MNDGWVNQQSIVHDMIDREIKYVAELDIVESLFMRPLEKTALSLIKQDPDSFITDVFYNILDLRECHRRLLARLRVRQQAQDSVIDWIGDAFLEAVGEFRKEYPLYVGHLPTAEKRLKQEMEHNTYLRIFIDVSR
jgi:hypothetical protein